MVISLRVVLVLVCLVSLISHASARPSSVRHSKQLRLIDHLLRSRAAAESRKAHHHNPDHQHRRRSADYEDFYDADYKRVQQCYEDVSCPCAALPAKMQLIKVFVSAFFPRNHQQEDINELCQRCSKVTKSSLVFPMCCNNEDHTMTWCKEYVYYGIQT